MCLGSIGSLLSQHFVFKPDVRGSRSIMHFGRVPVILRTRLEGPLSGNGATFRNPAPRASPSITTWEQPSPGATPTTPSGRVEVVIGVDAVEAVADLEMEGGGAVAADLGDFLAAANAVALGDAERADVGIDRQQVARVLDHHDGDAVGILGDRGDGAAVGGLDGGAGGGGDVDAVIAALGIVAHDI